MKRLIILVMFLLNITIVLAQNLGHFAYQAIVRDNAGQSLANSPVVFKITILSGTANGDVEYVERHNAVTSDFGLVNLQIGSGQIELGVFSSIEWGEKAHFLKIEIDITGNSTFTDMGTSQLLSVPYALYAKEAGNMPTNNGTVTSIATTDGITGGPITEDGTIGLTGQALALHNLSANGIVVRTGSETVTAREITAGQGITVNDGDGISGHPEILVNFGTTAGTVSEGNHTHTGMSPAGNTGHIQFNNAGVFDGSPNLYWDIDNARMGVGIDNPEGRMVVKQSSTAEADEPLFEVKNKDGQTVFVIYEDSVRIYINDDPTKATKGTFAVSGRNTTKNFTGDILFVSPDSTQIFVADDASKASKGTFAVSGRNTTKLFTNHFLSISPDSARIYTGDSIAGFAVKNISSTGKDSYMQLNPINIFIGHEAGYNNTDGIYNSFIGYMSGFMNTSGKQNSANGYMSMRYNTIGTYNTAMGAFSLYRNTEGNDNTAIGNVSLSSNTTGIQNVGLGSSTLQYLETGTANVAIGVGALRENISGDYNCAIGAFAGYASKGANNVFIGRRSGWFNLNGNNNAFIGYDAGYNSNSSNNVFVGYRSGYRTAGSFNVFIGYEVGYNNNNGLQNTSIGYRSLYSNADGNYLTAIGAYALYLNAGGVDNTAIGNNCLSSNTAGSRNVSGGSSSLQYNTDGNNNTAFGAAALRNNTTGSNNTALGYTAFMNGTNYSNSTAIGYNTAITASNRVAIGNTSVTWIGGQVSWSTYSDGRFKSNVAENVPGLDFILELRPVTYNYDMNYMAQFFNTPDSLRLFEAEKEKQKMSFTGFIAQEVDETAKKLGYDFSGVCKPQNEDDFYSIRYAEFTIPIIKSVQELNEIIKEIKAENELQKETINELKQIIYEMQAK